MVKITFLVLFFSFVAYGQEERVLNGKVIANTVDLEGIVVANLNHNQSVLTSNEGYFSIPAKVGDSLSFSSVQLIALKVMVSKEDIAANYILVKMQTLTRELKEVRIEENKKINTVAMGIVPKDVKTFTPSERKLNTASNPYARVGLGLGIGGFASGLDPLLNKISGRTKMLKKEVVVEQKEMMIHKLEMLFDEKFYVEQLKISQDYIKGFQYYVVEDATFANAINSKNKTLCVFLITQLAVDFNKLISDEK